jgi:hypothetical protein
LGYAPDSVEEGREEREAGEKGCEEAVSEAEVELVSKSDNGERF